MNGETRYTRPRAVRSLSPVGKCCAIRLWPILLGRHTKKRNRYYRRAWFMAVRLRARSVATFHCLCGHARLEIDCVGSEETYETVG
jgi:hypothetical protein